MCVKSKIVVSTLAVSFQTASTPPVDPRPPHHTDVQVPRHGRRCRAGLPRAKTCAWRADARVLRESYAVKDKERRVSHDHKDDTFFPVVLGIHHRKHEAWLQTSPNIAQTSISGFDPLKQSIQVLRNATHCSLKHRRPKGFYARTELFCATQKENRHDTMLIHNITRKDEQKRRNFYDFSCDFS